MKRFYIFAFMIFLLNLNFLQAGNVSNEDIAGSNGTYYEYYFTFLPALMEDDEDSGYYLYVYSEDSCNFYYTVPYSLEYETFELIGGELKKIKIPNELAVCYEKGRNEMPEKEQIFRGRAIHAYCETNISIMCAVESQNSFEVFSPIKQGDLGKNYTISSWNNNAADYTSDPIEMTSYTAIVGVYDNTKVEFIVGGNLNTKTPDGLRPGDKLTETLETGDIFLIPAVGENSDLSGSKVLANKPVSVISGNYCSKLSENDKDINHIIEQEIPEYMWGNHYAVTPISGTKAQTTIRIYPSEPNTTIYSGNTQIAKITNVNGLSQKGWITTKVIAPAYIHSDKPINVVQYNNNEDNAYNNKPYQMGVPSIENMSYHYAITYPDQKSFNNHNYMFLVYPISGNWFPESLKVGVYETDGLKWNSLFDTEGFSANSVGQFYKINNVLYYYVLINVDAYSNQKFEIKYDKKFSVAGFGYVSDDIAYGYLPNQFSPYDYNILDTVCPQVSYTMDCDGNVPADPNNPDDAKVVDWGTDPRFPPNVKDRTSNLGMIFFNQQVSYNYDFSYDDFIPGVDQETNFKLSVLNPNMDAHAEVSFTDRAGNDTTVIFNYKIKKLKFNMTNIELSMYEDKVSDQFLITNNYEQDTIEIDLIGDVNEKITITPEFPIKIPPSSSKYIDVALELHYWSPIVEEYILQASLPGSECLINQPLSVVANTKEKLPVLSVKDVNFGEVYTHREKFMELKVSNPSTMGSGQNLKIYGFKENNLLGEAHSNKVFELISQEFPIEIPVDDSIIMYVKFSPPDNKMYQTAFEYNTDILHHKDVPTLKGIGKLPGTKDFEVTNQLIQANPTKYKKDYFIDIDYDNSPVLSSAKIKNEGNETLKILNFEYQYYDDFRDSYLMEIDGEKYNIYSNEVSDYFKNLEVSPGDSISPKFYFNGAYSGKNYAYLELITNTEWNYHFDLTATGLYPKAEYKQLLFMGLPKYSGEELFKTITITNEDWTYSYPMTVYDVIPYRDTTVSDDWDDYKDFNFKFKKPDNLPVTLKPGESISIDVAFKKNIYDNDCYVRVLTNAEYDPVTYLYVEEATSVDNISDSKIDIFPNPAKDRITLTLNNSFEGKVEIYDILGNKVITKDVITSNKEINFDISELQEGVYFIKLDKYTLKFIKQL